MVEVLQLLNKRRRLFQDPVILSVLPLCHTFGFEVIASARNGRDAVQMFKEFSKKPDLIIMDNRMPIKSGIETMKEILQIDKSARVLFVSADMTIQEQALTTGAVGFVIKPFGSEEFIKTIHDALNFPTSTF